MNDIENSIESLQSKFGKGHKNTNFIDKVVFLAKRIGGKLYKRADFEIQLSTIKEKYNEKIEEFDEETKIDIEHIIEATEAYIILLELIEGK